jgi:hypothetical protein
MGDAEHHHLEDGPTGWLHQAWISRPDTFLDRSAFRL